MGNYLQEDILSDSEMVKDNYSLDETSYMHYVDSDGNIQELQKIYASTTDREWATYDQFPEELVHAAVAIEDKRFYEHQGVDWITTVKACVKMFVGTGDAGGSTITQQLVKNMTGDNSVTVRRKVVEIFKAIDFERRYDKDIIMEWYLNLIYFGDRKNGVKSAAAHYFGKELQSLTPAECASLISITNNPSIFSPYSSTFEYKGKLMTGAERNHIRKENTLWEMRNQGYLTEDEYQEALTQELVFKSGIAPEDTWVYCDNENCDYQGIVKTLTKNKSKYYCPECETEILVGENASKTVYSWFVDTVMEDVAAVLAERDGLVWDDLQKEQKGVYTQLIQRSGYHIYTTIDMKVQNQIDKIYTNLSEIPETRGAQQLQSGIVVIDNRTGDIVGMAGGVGEKKIFDGWNMATDAVCQVGSSFKPIGVYAPAFEMGEISPATVIKDMPLKYIKNSSGKRVAFPNNVEKRFQYSRTILSGIVDSVNAIAVNTLDEIGLKYSFEFATEKFRISDLVNNDRHSDMDYAPLALGGLTYGATVRDMACAYATFANNGVYREGRTFTKVYDSKGNLVIDNVQGSEEILSTKTIDYINYCLDKAVEDGTGKKADISGQHVCGKTGTTNSKKDRYFCGYTKYYTAAVWCGFEIPAEIQLVGDTSHPAARLWKKVLAPLHNKKTAVLMYNKSKMKEATVCLDSGLLVPSEGENAGACKIDMRVGNHTEVVRAYKEDLPKKTCNKHVVMQYCPEGKAVANDYCKKFAANNTKLKLEKKALVKLTKTQINEIIKAGNYGLNKDYLNENAVYLVNSSGKPVDFAGFDGEYTATGPYLTCQVHTKEAWEKFQKDNKIPDDTDSDEKPSEKPTEKPEEKPTEKPTATKPKQTNASAAAMNQSQNRSWLTELAELFQ
jgi:penicillin-binding protein 1A